MKNLMLFLSLLLSIPTFAATDKYRLMFNDDPATMVTIAWNQISGNNPEVYYGTQDFGTNWSAYPNSGVPYRTTNYFGMNNQFVKLTGLQPNTNYYFVIRDSEGTSDRFWFKTCPDVNTERLSFISGGDSRSGQTQRINSNIMVAKIRPHAVLFGGDIVNTPSNTSIQTWMDDWQYSFTSDNQIIPLVHSFGNHEDYGTGGPNLMYDLFDTPYDVYYNVTFGGDLFSLYTLNGELLPGHTIPNASKRAAQTSWLASELPNDNAIWKSAQYHRPIVPHYSGKGEGADEFNDWAQLFYDYGVRLVFESDAHVTKMTEEVKPVNPTASGNSSNWFTTTGIDPNKGITFIGEGAWGTIRNPDDIHPFTTAYGSFYQFNLIFVDACKIEIRTIDTQNPGGVPEHQPGDYFSISSGLEAQVWKPTQMPTGVREIAYCYPPEVDFTANNTSVFTGTTIQFTDLSTNTPTSWSWDFGDGNNSTQQNPQNTYNTAGVYDVTLSATNNDGSGNMTKTAYIEVIDPTPPTAYFTSDNQIVTLGTSIAFTDTSYGIPSSWSWDFGDGNTSATQNPSHTYTNSGTYTVKLTVGNALGQDSLTKVNYITVNNGGSFSTTITEGSDDVEEFNSDGSLYFTSSDLEMCYDGGFGENQHVGLRFQNITIPQGAVITNAYIQFRADETDNTNLDIYIHGVDEDNAAPWSGNYDVSGRAATTANTTWVHNNNTAWIGGVTIDQTPNINTIVQEVVDRNGWNSGNSMSFVFYDNNIENDERVADSYEGGYPAELIIDYVVPNPSPVASFASNNTEVCLGENIEFNDQSANFPTSWSWDFGDGNNSSQYNPSHVYNSPGTYSVSLTVTNSSGTDQVTFNNYITVYDLPVVTLNDFEHDAYCEEDGLIALPQGNPPGGSFSGDGVSGVDFSPSLAGVGNHVITYTYEDGNGCVNEANVSVTVEGCLTVDEKSIYYNIYPNPANTFLYIEFESNIDARIEIYNAGGQSVYNASVTGKSNKVDVVNWSSGVYVVKIIDKNKNFKEHRVLIE